MNWKQVISVICILVGAVSAGGWMTALQVTVAAAFASPQIAPIPPPGSQETDRRDREDRLNADFSRMSERYRREFQRGGGPDDGWSPEPSRAERKRQALEDITDRDGHTPKLQNPPQHRRNRWLQRFQLHLDPFE